MDWALMHTFLAVAETGSLSAAAERLGSSQPTVGRHVRALEAAVGRTLFRRLPRGLELTEAGLGLIDDARSMAEAADAFARKASGGTDAVAGTIRVTASRMVSSFLLPAIVAAIRTDAPALDFEIVASDAAQNLIRRDADIAVRMFEPREPQLVRRHVGDLPLAVYAAPTYLARRGTPARLADLLDHDVIGFDRADDLLRGFARHGLPVVREWFPIRCDDHVVAYELVAAGAGIGFCQVAIADADPRLVRLPVEDVGFALPVWLTYHQDLRHTRRIRFVVDRLAAGLAAVIAGVGR